MNNEEECFNQVSEGSLSCQEGIIRDSCSLVFVGERKLSEYAKSKFPDYCLEFGSTVEFENADNEKISATIINRDYQTSAYFIITSFNSPDCTYYCLENEAAQIVLESDRFTLEIDLQPGIRIGAVGYSDVETRFSIFAQYQNTRQYIFGLPIEDNEGQPIVTPDTNYIRYHEIILLNGKEYTELYSNENNNANGLVRKEKVYFHPKNGLIAVRDSLGELWTKVK